VLGPRRACAPAVFPKGVLARDPPWVVMNNTMLGAKVARCARQGKT
jgi:hypothetical protein